MEIENFTLKEFAKQSDDLKNEYIVALQYLKPRKTRRAIANMKLKHVDYIRNNIYSSNEENLLAIVEKVEKLKRNEVLEMPIITFFSLRKSIIEQIERIVFAEQNALGSSEINFKWIAVDGDNKMRKFGIFNTLEALSNGDATKYNHYRNMKYSEAFTILYMRKEKVGLQKQMDAIKLPN
jgi:hypothetical protein